jgi:hypothetical protein
LHPSTSVTKRAVSQGEGRTNGATIVARNGGLSFFLVVEDIVPDQKYIIGHLMKYKKATD